MYKHSASISFRPPFFFYVQLTSFGNFLGKASTKTSTELAKLLVELSLF